MRLRVLSSPTPDLLRSPSRRRHDDGLCGYEVVSVARASSRVLRIRPRGRHVGYRLHLGWAQWWVAAVPRWLRNGPTLFNLEGAGCPHRRLIRDLQKESSVQWPKISRSKQSWNPRETVHEQPIEEGSELDEWVAEDESGREDDGRAGSVAPMVRWYQESWGGCSFIEHDDWGSASNLL